MKLLLLYLFLSIGFLSAAQPITFHKTFNAASATVTTRAYDGSIYSAIKGRLVKLDSMGNALWANQYDTGTVAHLYINYLQKTADSNLVIVGTLTTSMPSFDVTVIKVNQDGNAIWARKISTPHRSYGNSVKTTMDGGFIIQGSQVSTIFPGQHGSLLTKLDSSGNLVWSKGYSAAQYQIPGDVIETARKEYLMLSYDSSIICITKTDSIGNVVWKQRLDNVRDGGALQPFDDTSFLVVGTKYKSGQIALLARIHTDGHVLWAKTYHAERGRYVCGTSDGGLMLLAMRNSDALFVKTDHQGTPQWAKRYGGTVMDDPFYGEQLSDGYLLTGTSHGYLGWNTAFIIKTDLSGVSGFCEDSEVVIAVPDTVNLTAIAYQESTMGTISNNTLKVSQGTIGVDTPCINFVNEVQNISVPSISLFPNPSGGVVHFRSQAANCELEIFNLLNNKVYSSEITKRQTDLDLRHLAKGIYIYSVRSKEHYIAKGKLLLQ